MSKMCVSITFIFQATLLRFLRARNFDPKTAYKYATILHLIYIEWKECIFEVQFYIQNGEMIHTLSWTMKASCCPL